MNNNRLWTKSLPDTPERKNVQFLKDIIAQEAVLKFEWEFMTFTTKGAVTNQKISHGLAFQPTDVIVTRSSNNITFNYDLFSDKFLDITTSGAATFRGLVGRYRENEE